MPQLEQVSLFSSLIFWSLISFAVLFVLFWKQVIPPILQALEDRAKKISGDIQTAEELRAEGEKIKAEFDGQLQAAHDKASAMVQSAHDESRKVQESSLNETQAKVRQMLKEAEQEIQESRTKLMGEIRDYLSALTLASAEKIINRSLGGEDNKRLIEESIEESIGDLTQ